MAGPGSQPQVQILSEMALVLSSSTLMAVRALRHYSLTPSRVTCWGRRHEEDMVPV